MTEANSDTVDPSERPPHKEVKDFWGSVERLAKTLSIAAIPVVLAAGSWIIQKRLQDQTVSRDYVQLAVTILKEPGSSNEMKVWAVQLLNDNSPTKFNAEISRQLSTGQVQLPASFNLSSSTTAATPDTSNLRIYLLSGKTNAGADLDDLRNDITAAGFAVVGARGIVDPGRPDEPEIRYFFAADQAQAEKVADVMRQRSPDSKYPAKQYQSPKVKPGYIEIWLGR